MTTPRPPVPPARAGKPMPPHAPQRAEPRPAEPPQDGTPGALEYASWMRLLRHLAA